MNATKTEVSMNDVEREIISAMTQADDKGRNWWAVRVGTDGTPYTSEEVSRCESESEYFGHAPHPVTVWTHTSNGSSSPGDCSRDWDDCDETDAEFFASESPTRGVYGDDWCNPKERDEYPQCTVPKRLGKWTDLDLSDLMDEVRAKLEAVEWLEVVD
jgi:hypothetical protein